MEYDEYGAGGGFGGGGGAAEEGGAAAAAAGEGTTFSCEVAPSGRATCKDVSCKKAIEKGSWRITKKSVASDGMTFAAGYHPECWAFRSPWDRGRRTATRGSEPSGRGANIKK